MEKKKKKIFWAKLSSRLEQGTNPFRWMEYSMSASIMMVVLGILLGIDDFSALVLLAVSMASCNLLGWSAEISRSKMIHFFGWVPFFAGWWILYEAFMQGEFGGYTHFLFPLMLVGFTLFGVVQLVQCFGMLGKRYINVEYGNFFCPDVKYLFLL